MGVWSDLAVWRGPTPNHGGAMIEHRGCVVHIAEGFFEGTISWQRNDASNVSSHFIVGRAGQIAQMVDTDVTAWTQSAGNGHWLSIENEGFTPNSIHYRTGWEFLTPQQIEANAQLLARGHAIYGYPLVMATNPLGRGLGHHSMGCNWPGGAWGHCDCPGPDIIAQKQQILDRALEITDGDDMSEWSQPDPWGVDPDGHNRTPAQKQRDHHAAIYFGARPIGGDGKPTGPEPWIVASIKQLQTAVAGLVTPAPAPVDVTALVAALRPELEAAVERTVRRVLGKLDEQ